MCSSYSRYRKPGYINGTLLVCTSGNDPGDGPMMTEAEIQMISYAQGILRSRGYSEAVENLNAVIGTEVERRGRLMSPPPPTEWRATG